MISTQADFTICTGTDLLIKSLLAQKTEVVFGSLGGSLLLEPLDICEKLNQVVLIHEQATVHAADGYARATGKVGVVLIPSGSGFTNAVTGIATAQMDSVPLVIIACPESEMNLNLDPDNDIDVFGITTPITKYYHKITDVADITRVLKEAFFIAGEGRPGPVVIELHKEVLTSEAPLNSMRYLEIRMNTKQIVPDRLLECVKVEIAQAKKPVLLIGGGVPISGAARLVRELSERANIPVVSTLMGIGSFPGNHGHFLGMVGMHGTFAANKAVHRADLLICLGVRFSDRVTGKKSSFSPKSRKIQIDIDPAEINKNVQVDIPIVADLNSVLKKINEILIPGDTNEWIKETSTWQRIAPRFSESKSELKPQQVVKLLDQYSNGNAIVATDVGQHQIWTSHYYKFDTPRSFLTSGGLGTMGYGVPAAIGAAVASKGRNVICISGDGSFQMNLQELITIARYQLPIKIAILNNGYLGMVRQWQEMFYNSRYSSVKVTSPDFVKLAHAYDIQAERACTLPVAEMMIKKAFSHNDPIVMEFDISEEENVFPIVPPGGSNSESILE